MYLRKKINSALSKSSKKIITVPKIVILTLSALRKVFMLISNNKGREAIKVKL